MGSSAFSSVDYSKAVDHLNRTGQTFARSTAAQATGNVRNVADILNPRKLKGGMREACFTAGFEDVTPIVVSIDGTGSMDKVPFVLQKELPKLIDLLTEKGVSDHPNVLFLCHDDEHAVPPDAAFQMSQFEAGNKELLDSLNELIIPHHGGGNQGEAYHLSIYAAANHTRLESFERDGTKGFFFLIGDEEPYYEAADPTNHGTSPEIAKEVFGDMIEKEVTMLESLKKVLERYHFFVIRPGHTSNGQNATIGRMWQKLVSDAGGNPEHVLFVPETDAIVSTMALAIGRIVGADNDDLVDVLRSKGAKGISGAVAATTAIMPSNAGTALTTKASGTIVTAGNGGRRARC